MQGAIRVQKNGWEAWRRRMVRQKTVKFHYFQKTTYLSQK